MVVKPVYSATALQAVTVRKTHLTLFQTENSDLFSRLVNSSDEYAGASYKLTSDIIYNDWLTANTGK